MALLLLESGVTVTLPEATSTWNRAVPVTAWLEAFPPPPPRRPAPWPPPPQPHRATTAAAAMPIYHRIRFMELSSTCIDDHFRVLALSAARPPIPCWVWIIGVPPFPPEAAREAPRGAAGRK